MEQVLEHKSADVVFILSIALVILISWALINFGAPKATFALLFNVIDLILVAILVGFGIKFNRN